MTTVWGGSEGHLQVGINAWTSSPGPNSTSVTVYLRVHVRIPDSWRFDDNQNYSVSGSHGDSGSFHNGLSGAGDQMLIYSTQFSQGISYSGGPTLSWTASISGMYNGGTPSVSRSLTMPRRPASAPDKPNVTSISSITATSATVNWNTPASNGATLDAHAVELDDQSNFSSPGPTFGDADNWATSHHFTGLAKGTRYWAHASAHNAAGWSGYGGSLSFTTPTTAPGTPTGVGFSGIGATSVNIDWSAPADDGGTPITGYVVQRATNSSFTSGLVSATPVGSSLSLTGLGKNTTYFVRVKAVNATGESSYSGTTSFTTAATAPGAPAAPTIGTVTPTSVVVSWSAPSDTGGLSITGYDVQRSTNSSFTGDAVTVTDNASPNTLTGLLPGKTYFVRVRAKNAQGAGDWSPAISTATLSGVKVGSGTQWKDAVVRVGNGTSWVVCQIRHGDGSSWS